MSAASPPSFATLLQPYVDQQALAGAVVAVADRRGVLTLESVGFADIDTGKRMQTDAIFWIASMTKPMTGVAIMMLVDQGKISLDDPAEKYLPEFKHLWRAVYGAPDCVVLRRPTRTPTIRELMCHTGGMTFCAPTEFPFDMMTLAEATRAYALTPLAYEPGTEYRYSNMGINACGRIVEVVTGEAYEDFMQTRILAPLGMNDTTFWPDKQQLARLAKAYTPDAEKKHLVETKISQLTTPYDDRLHRTPMPAGGYFSTAADVLRFGQMLLNGGTFEGRTYLSESAMSEIRRKQTPASIDVGYSVGFAVDSDNFGHGGALATNFKVSPEYGITMTYLVQHDGFLHEGGKIIEKVWTTARDLAGR